jgi:hypothetical protein
MNLDLDKISQAVTNVTQSNSALDTLMSFERVLDELDLYAFRNWKLGELVQGPDTSRYYVTCTFMWPRKLMPDPRGGQRLLEHGCQVRYRRGRLYLPRPIKDPSDFRPGTKVPRLDPHKIWIVEIVMPLTLVGQIEVGSLELESAEANLSEIDQAYEQDQESGNQPMQQEQ